MKKLILKFTGITGIILTIAALLTGTAGAFLSSPFSLAVNPPDTSAKRTDLPFPFDDPAGKTLYNQKDGSGLYLQDPSNIKKSVEFDPEKREYIITERYGSFDYKRPVYMTLDEYKEYEYKRQLDEYWNQKKSSLKKQQKSGRILQGLSLGEEQGGIFGTNAVSIVPRGSAELIFGIKRSVNNNPALSERARKSNTFDFDAKIQMNVNGSIGDKMKLNISYDTENTFEFENEFKLEYSGKEDEIIRKIEAGNVSLPLSGSLITGSQNLMGLKTELQFGRLTVTSVVSQQKSKAQTIQLEGGSQKSYFEVSADEYEANKHFFLSHYFKDNYDRWMANLPNIGSNITITDIEVWVTNKRGDYKDSRNVVAFMDLAENGSDIYNQTGISSTPGKTFPENDANTLYGQVTSSMDRNNFSMPAGIADMISGRDYERIEQARLLQPNEYTLNAKLGYISLNSALNNDEILAVYFQYTVDGVPYTVGEKSNNPSAGTLVLKLIKGTTLSPRLKTWDLMMKNIYATGAYQLTAKDFILQVLYQDNQTGNYINYLPIEENNINKRQLIDILNLDNLNAQGDQNRDGRFDYLEGITIISRSGRVIFPVREPFGDYLWQKITNTKIIGYDEKGNRITDREVDRKLKEIANKYTFPELYDSTQTKAKQIAEKNKFSMRGSYVGSSGSEITLNAMNIPRGSVKVTAGGRILEENVHYTVDYLMGRVTIIDKSLLESNTPINVSLENNAMFDFQQKTLLGTNLNYRISDNFNIGGTILNLSEKPVTKKVNLGDDPISNTIWGLNTSYKSEVPFLTYLVDKLPLISTKEKSNVTIVGEVAQLIPGHSRAIEKEGVVYIDDFEGTKISYDMKLFTDWILSSVPQNSGLFPEGSLHNNLNYNKNRAKLNWFSIDRVLQSEKELSMPEHLKRNKDLRSNAYVHMFFQEDIFPNRDNVYGYPIPQSFLNLAYYPDERGPYNYNYEDLNPEGKFINPQNKWAGIMRKTNATDFEAQNIEFIEFWLLDPFIDDTNGISNSGKLYFNIGNISEDILKDGRHSFEQGLPTGDKTGTVDTTAWGIVPKYPPLTQMFANENLAQQDVGLDGLSNEKERLFFSDYIEKIKSKITNQSVLQQFIKDPTNDDYLYYKSDYYDSIKAGIIERYKHYNGLEGNSIVSGQSSSIGSSLPDKEDINDDNTLSEAESYFQYLVELSPEKLKVGQNYITDSIRVNVTYPNKKIQPVNFYQFRIPLSDFQAKVGAIEDFRSIRFVRMFLTGFSKEVILRFATLDLVKSEWRKYNRSMQEAREEVTVPEPVDALFEISAVNIEENGNRWPVNYVLPPGITRETDPFNNQLTQLNEQAIVLKVINLEDGDARALFKNVKLDLRNYKRLKMFVHAEAIDEFNCKDGEVTAFIRLGNDYTDNYYEYEVPLWLTPHLAKGGKYSNAITDDRRKVWPDSNQFDINLELFTRVKTNRNMERNRDGSVVTMNTVYKMTDSEHPSNYVKVKGNPSLSDVRTIMIGIRNPSKNNRRSRYDDGLPKSVEVWMNELRLSEFDEKGGWAATGRIMTKLADFGSISVAGSKSTPGFGSLGQKIDQRQKETIEQLDISTNFELGKFFPEKIGASVPLYMGYSLERQNPQYNPLEPDMLVKDASNDSTRRAIRDAAMEITERKSINLTNIKVNNLMKKESIINPSNLTGSYSWTETFSKDFNTDYRHEYNTRWAFTYAYNARPKNIAPLDKIKFLNKKALRLIKDFNFYYLPSNISIRTDIDRNFYSEKIKNINADLGDNDVIQREAYILPSIKPDKFWNRYYDVKYDLTKMLKLDFSAQNRAKIDPFKLSNDEMENYFYNHDYVDFYNDWKKNTKIINNAFTGRSIELGNNISYNHSFNATYTLPVNKLPFLDWTSSSLRYNTSYAWTRGPQNLINKLDGKEINLGNTIKNSNTLQGNGQLNFTTLYNKSKFLKDVNQRIKQRENKNRPKKFKTVSYQEVLNFRAKISKTVVHKLKTTDVKVIISDASGKRYDADVKVIDENKVQISLSQELKNATVIIDGKVEEKESMLRIIGDYLLGTTMSVKNISGNYSLTNGSLFPGFNKTPTIMGVSIDESRMFAPGFRYVAGLYPMKLDDTSEIKKLWLNEYKWFTTDTLMNTPYNFSRNERYDFRANAEPIPGMRIDINAMKTNTSNFSGNYKYIDPGNAKLTNRIETGNMSLSVIALRTAFKDKNSKNNTSVAFENFKNTYAREISKRRHLNHAGSSDLLDSAGYYNGYGLTSQDVLVPAFLAAYTGKDVNKTKLDVFNEVLPLPNWIISYDGLGKLPFLRKYVRSVNLRHTYRSTFSIGNYRSNLNYQPNTFDKMGNYLVQKEISSISLSEQFSPLISIDVTTINNLLTRFEYKKDRLVNLSLSNNQINETNGEEIVFGTGYRIKDVAINVSGPGGQTSYKSDIDIRFDFSWRDNHTDLRPLLTADLNPVEGITQSGTKIRTWKLTADYVLSDRFNIRAFVDQEYRKQYGTEYKNVITNFGFSVRFTLVE